MKEPYYNYEADRVNNLHLRYIGSTFDGVEESLLHHTNPERRIAVSGTRNQEQFGATTIPNYYFFVFMLKTVKKLRNYFIPLHLKGPDLSSIYANQRY